MNNAASSVVALESKQSQPIKVASDITIDVSEGIVQLGSLGCEDCSVLLYSIVDKTLATFSYAGGNLSADSSLDLAQHPTYYFNLASKTDNHGELYFALSIVIYGQQEVLLMNIREEEQAKSAIASLSLMEHGSLAVH